MGNSWGSSWGNSWGSSWGSNSNTFSTNIGLVSETDVLLSISGLKSKSVGLVSETDVLLSISGANLGPRNASWGNSWGSSWGNSWGVLNNSGILSATIGLISETDSVFSLSPAKSKDINLVNESDIQFGINSKKLKSIGLTTETDVLFNIISARDQILGILSEVDNILSPTILKIKSLQILGETDTPLGLVLSLAVSSANLDLAQSPVNTIVLNTQGSNNSYSNFISYMVLETFDVGTVLRLSASFYNIDNDLVDPTSVTFKMKEPDGTLTNYTYNTNSEMIKDSTGSYYVDWPITQHGTHIWYFKSTGNGQAYKESNFRVRKPRL